MTAPAAALAAVAALAVALAAPRVAAGQGAERRAASRVPEIAATAPASAEERAALVEAYLGAIDRVVPPEAWRALGPEAVPALAEVAGDPRAMPSRRAAALQGLAALGGEAAEAAHLAQLRAAEAPRIVRLAATRGLGRLLDPARLAAELAPVLDEPDGGLRRAAAEVLAERAPVEGCAVVRDRAARAGPDAKLAPAIERCR